MFFLSLELADARNFSIFTDRNEDRKTTKNDTMNNKQLVLLGCGLAAAPASWAQQAAEQLRPNIIYIMCDDLGYADVGCYGQQYISTPNLDRMAEEGMRFTQAYAGSPVSAPSRACFMTGQHTGHTKIRGNKEWTSGSVEHNGVTDDARVGQEPYDTAHVIIPKILKTEGYTTGMFGKWAGGYEGSISTPKTWEIDEYYGYVCQYQAHRYYPKFLNSYIHGVDEDVKREWLEENLKYGIGVNDPTYLNRPQYSAQLIHDRAMAWLDKQNPADKPFFGIFTYTLPHAELAQPNDSILQAYQGAFCDDGNWGGTGHYHAVEGKHQQFAAMVTRLDKYVGEVLNKLREKGWDDNTLVVFTSDNGPHQEGGADPEFFNTERLLQGTKRSTHEGGIRVPFIAWWPGQVEAGAVNDHQLAFYDIMPTFCELVGVENYDSKYANPRLVAEGKEYFDGISFAPTLLGEAGQEQHEFLYWEFHETNMMALRMGDWKLVVQNGNCRLYDLSVDTHEDTDLAAQHPEIVEQMKAIILREHVDSDISNFKNNLTLPTLAQ